MSFGGHYEEHWEALNARETADRYGVNERTVRRAIKDGRLNADKVGGEFCVLDVEARAVFGEPKALASRVSELEEKLEEIRGDIYLYGIGEITKDQLLLHLFTGKAHNTGTRRSDDS